MQAFYEFLDLKLLNGQGIVKHIASLAQLVEHLICNHQYGYYARQYTTIFRSFLRFLLFVKRGCFCKMWCFFECGGPKLDHDFTDVFAANGGIKYK